MAGPVLLYGNPHRIIEQHKFCQARSLTGEHNCTDRCWPSACTADPMANSAIRPDPEIQRGQMDHSFFPGRRLLTASSPFTVDHSRLANGQFS